MKKNNPNRRPIVVDLFSGAGGLSLGFEEAGFDVAAAIEIDPIHCAVHHFNFPYTTTICASVTDLTGEEIRQRAHLEEQDIDVVCGGAPCQGFSMIGLRAMDDPRNQLVFHFVRLVNEMKPKYFVFENVKGLTVGAHKKFLQEVVEAFLKIGYEILLPWRVLNAAEFGVPQDRQRLFLIGARHGITLPEYPMPTERVTVADAIADLPNVDEFDCLLQNAVVRTQFNTTSSYARKLRLQIIDQTNYGHQRQYDEDLLTSSARTLHTDLSKQRFMDTAVGEVEKISHFLKLDPKGLCNTLRAGTDSARGAFTSPRPIHPHYPRVITVREGARLHSYPDWFRFHTTKWHGFRQIGNSVPPKLARAVASQLLKAMQIVPIKPSQKIQSGDESLLHFDMHTAAKFFSVPSTVIAQRTRKIFVYGPAIHQHQLAIEQKRKHYEIEAKG